MEMKQEYKTTKQKRAVMEQTLTNTQFTVGTNRIWTDITIGPGRTINTSAAPGKTGKFAYIRQTINSLSSKSTRSRSNRTVIKQKHTVLKQQKSHKIKAQGHEGNRQL